MAHPGYLRRTELLQVRYHIYLVLTRLALTGCTAGGRSSVKVILHSVYPLSQFRRSSLMNSQQWDCPVRSINSVSSSYQLMGSYSFVDQQTAWSTGLVYIESDGTVIMKGDNTTWLSSGQVRSRWALRIHSIFDWTSYYRRSVRISSITQYTGGLFILDLNRAPWGCGEFDNTLRILFGLSETHS